MKEWKRPNEIFGIDKLVVQPTEDKNDVLNLLAVNEPLMNVKVIKIVFLTLYSIKLYRKSECSSTKHSVKLDNDSQILPIEY